jgi:hypothetical protein
MNIFEAASSGKPFSNPSMIGAFMLNGNTVVHRDNECDFKDQKNWANSGSDYLDFMPASYIKRTDWYTINL